jgi:hypothetical protein
LTQSYGTAVGGHSAILLSPNRIASARFLSGLMAYCHAKFEYGRQHQRKSEAKGFCACSAR